jgi:GH15 family glucan-1,4-alpha-glucosidase
MYGIGGERDLTERTLDHLSGYRGARPVRVGNGAWDHLALIEAVSMLIETEPSRRLAPSG